PAWRHVRDPSLLRQRANDADDTKPNLAAVVELHRKGRSGVQLERLRQADADVGLLRVSDPATFGELRSLERLVLRVESDDLEARAEIERVGGPGLVAEARGDHTG